MIVGRMKRVACGVALPVLLSMSLGMRLTLSPGCTVDGGGWVSADGGCRDTNSGGLVWSVSGIAQARPEMYYTYYSAQDYCNALVEGDKDDWRAPTLAEQQNASAHAGGEHIQIDYDGYKWSTTYSSKTKKSAYLLRFGDGSVLSTGIYDPRVGYSRHDVVCVRTPTP